MYKKIWFTALYECDDLMLHKTIIQGCYGVFEQSFAGNGIL